MMFSTREELVEWVKAHSGDLVQVRTPSNTYWGIITPDQRNIDVFFLRSALEGEDVFDVALEGARYADCKPIKNEPQFVEIEPLAEVPTAVMLAVCGEACEKAHEEGWRDLIAEIRPLLDELEKARESKRLDDLNLDAHKARLLGGPHGAELAALRDMVEEQDRMAAAQGEIIDRLRARIDEGDAL